MDVSTMSKEDTSTSPKGVTTRMDVSTTSKDGTSTSSKGVTTRHQTTPHPKAQPQSSKEDYTILNKPILTSKSGLPEAVLALESSSPEIRDLLLYECNLIYECKSCFNMFRSPVNFIAHKRSFCRAKHKNLRHLPRGDVEPFEDTFSSTSAVIVQPEAPINTIPESNFDLADYYPSLELLKDLGIAKEIEMPPKVRIFNKTETKKSIDKIAKDLLISKDSRFAAEHYRSKIIHLEQMKATNKAVFQTIGKEYVSLEEAKNPPAVVIDPFNKPVNPGIPSSEFRADLEEIREGSKLSFLFPCPDCKKFFARICNVLLHLCKIHNYSQQKAESTKEFIRKNRIIKKSKASNQVQKLPASDIKNRTCSIVIEKLSDDEIKRLSRPRHPKSPLVTKDIRVACERLNLDGYLNFIQKKSPIEHSIMPIKSLNTEDVSGSDSGRDNNSTRSTASSRSVTSSDSSQMMEEDEEDSEIEFNLPKIASRSEQIEKDDNKMSSTSDSSDSSSSSESSTDDNLKVNPAKRPRKQPLSKITKILEDSRSDVNPLPGYSKSEISLLNSSCPSNYRVTVPDTTGAINKTEGSLDVFKQQNGKGSSKSERLDKIKSQAPSSTSETLIEKSHTLNGKVKPVKPGFSKRNRISISSGSSDNEKSEEDEKSKGFRNSTTALESGSKTEMLKRISRSSMSVSIFETTSRQEQNKNYTHKENTLTEGPESEEITTNDLWKNRGKLSQLEFNKLQTETEDGESSEKDTDGIPHSTSKRLSRKRKRNLPFEKINLQKSQSKDSSLNRKQGCNENILLDISHNSKTRRKETVSA